jgi:2-keto-4-pentenoate hydratase
MGVAWYDPRIARGMAAQLTRWHQQLKAGEKALGWKVGCGTPEMKERLRIDAPLVGYLTDKSSLSPTKPVSLTGWHKPVAEAEIALVMAKDLPRGASRDLARAAIGSLAPAFELVDVTEPPEDVTQILSGNLYQRHVILGTRDATRARCSVEGLIARVSRNGENIATVADVQEPTGDYVDIVCHVGELLAAFGERLCAGHIIIMGSLTAPIFVSPGDQLTYELEPVGSLSVTFE